MAFTKKIKAESPDKYLKAATGRREDGQAQLARLAHVNALQSETEDGLQLCSTQIETAESSAGLPKSLQKTATRIEYSDGVVLEGWQLTVFSSLDGTTNTFSTLSTLRIPEVPGEGNGGYYLPFKLSGTVKALDDGIGNVITIFQNGSEFRDTDPGSPTVGQTVQCDSLSIVENTTGFPELGIVDFEVTGLANTPRAEAEIVTQFEFLCYEGVIPVLT